MSEIEQVEVLVFGRVVVEVGLNKNLWLTENYQPGGLTNNIRQSDGRIREAQEYVRSMRRTLKPKGKSAA